MEIDEREIERAIRETANEAACAESVYKDRPYAKIDRLHSIVKEHMEKLKKGYFSSLK